VFLHDVRCEHLRRITTAPQTLLYHNGLFVGLYYSKQGTQHNHWKYSWFKLIYLRSIAKQVIRTYMNHSWPLIPDCIHLFFWMRFEKREARPVLICWAPSNEASGTILIASLVWRGQGSNPRPPAHGANALTTEPRLRF